MMHSIGTLPLPAAAEPPLAPGLEPDTVLPVQFRLGTTLDASSRPEKRLMLAVLEEGVGTFQRYVGATDRQGRRLFAEAEAWFASDDTGWPFAFVVICQALGLDEAYVRAGLWRWRDRQRSAPAGASRVYRFPFRRVGGTRHKATGRAVGLRRSA